MLTEMIFIIVSVTVKGMLQIIQRNNATLVNGNHHVFKMRKRKIVTGFKSQRAECKMINKTFKFFKKKILASA